MTQRYIALERWGFALADTQRIDFIDYQHLDSPATRLLRQFQLAIHVRREGKILLGRSLVREV